MKIEQIKGSEFKWISPITGGETFGIVKKVYKYRFEYQTMIESTNGNVYDLNECYVKVGDEYEKIHITE